MTLQAAIQALFGDNRLESIFAITVLDFVLGVFVALRAGTFRLSYISDTLKSDVLGKVLPFSALYIGWKLTPGAQVLVSFVDLEVLVDGAFALVVAALVGSLLASLKELGLFSGLTDQIAGPDPATPPEVKPPPST